MSTQIKLSIIVPIYNVEKYLDDCINSVIKNYRDGLEVILVDDGSKDNSGKIADDFASKYDYISVIHRENGGLSAARNTGIRAAVGEYIWFVDSDDFIDDTSITDIYNAMEKNTDIIMGNYRQVFPDGKTFFYQPFKEEDNLNVLPYKYFHSLGNISYAAVRFIVKRQLIEKHKIFFTEGIYHEDEEWTPRVLCAAKTFTTILPAIYNYRVGNPNSIIGKPNPKKVLDKIWISKSIKERIDKNNLPVEMVEFLRSRIAHNYIAALNECSIYNDESRKKLATELRNNRELINDVAGKKAQLVKYSIKAIGVVPTSKLLRFRSERNK